MYSLFKSLTHFCYVLLKITFWMCLVLLILPISVEEEDDPNSPQLSTDQTIEAAQDFYDEVSGFCERVPSVCETSSAVVHLIGQKARAAAQIAVGYLDESDTLDDEQQSVEID